MDAANDRPYARAPQVEDLVRICRSLNESGARYVLIGGFAVIAHGGARTTRDIDLLVDDSPGNIARVKSALRVLTDRAADEVADDDVRRYAVVRVADEVIVDLMGRACGLTYSDVMQDAGAMEVGGVLIPVASKRALIRTKETVRPSDLADRQFLQSLIDEEERDRDGR
ncbi:MAG: nucleotidyltransferase [Candidatus Rokubacteria bacterium]|nr:nucleotidyltransferase [Candidatus Rokubacteria bacterium]